MFFLQLVVAMVVVVAVCAVYCYFFVAHIIVV